MSSNQGEASLTGEAQQPEGKETGGDGQLKGSKRAKVQRQKEKRRLRKEQAAKAAKDEESILDEARARAENFIRRSAAGSGGDGQVPGATGGYGQGQAAG